MIRTELNLKQRKKKHAPHLKQFVTGCLSAGDGEPNFLQKITSLTLNGQFVFGCVKIYIPLLLLDVSQRSQQPNVELHDRLVRHSWSGGCSARLGGAGRITGPTVWILFRLRAQIGRTSRPFSKLLEFSSLCVPVR